MKDLAIKTNAINRDDFEGREKFNIILFLSGKIASLLGTHIYSFAISLYVLKVTGSGTSFALSVLMSMVPRILLGPFAGSFADRFDRKKMVVLLDALSGVTVLSLLGISTLYGLRIPFIYLTSFTLAVINTFFNISIGAALPNLVSDKNLMKINAYQQSASSLASIMGPVMGGLIYGLVSMKLFLLVNGLSFIISAISEMFIDFKFNKERIKDEDSDKSSQSERVSFKSIIEDIKEVWGFIKTLEALSTMLRFTLVFNMLINATFAIIIPYIINNVLKLSSTQFGIIQGGFPLGMLITSIIIGKLPEQEKKLKRLVFGIAMIGLLVIGGGLPTLGVFSGLSNNIIFIYYIALMFGLAVFVVIVDTPIIVSIQRLTPDKMMGRVMGVLQTISGGIAPLGVIVAGVLVDVIPPYIIPIVSGIIITSLAIIMKRVKGMKNF